MRCEGRFLQVIEGTRADLDRLTRVRALAVRMLAAGEGEALAVLGLFAGVARCARAMSCMTGSSMTFPTASVMYDVR